MFLNKAWAKWICSLLVSRCCVSMYAFTWCSHSCTHLVLVSFLTKESSSFALMVTLVEPPFRAPSMTPNPYAIWPNSLAIFWFSTMVSPSCTTNDQKISKKAKNSLDVWSIFGLASSHVSKDLSTSRCSRACLLTFPFFGSSKGKIKECTSPLDLEDEWNWYVQATPFLVLELFPFAYFFWKPQEFLLNNPCSPFLPSFEWQWKEFFMGLHFARACLILPFCILLNLLWRSFHRLLHQVSDALSLFITKLLTNHGLTQSDRVFHNYILFLLLLGLVLLIGLGFHHNHCSGYKLISIRGHLP